MDLYEALKSGTTSEELEKKFKEELTAAKAKFKAEEESRNAILDTLRTDLALDIKDYISYLCGQEYEDLISENDIKNGLIAFEKDVAEFRSLMSALFSKTKPKTKASASKKPEAKTDDEIIKDFLSLFN